MNANKLKRVGIGGKALPGRFPVRRNTSQSSSAEFVVKTTATSNPNSIESETNAEEPTDANAKVKELVVPEEVSNLNAGIDEGSSDSATTKSAVLQSDSSVEVATSRSAVSIETRKYSSGRKKNRSYKELQFDRILSSNRIHLPELRSAAWNGIPGDCRALAWKVLLNYAPRTESTRRSILQKKRNDYQSIVKKFWDDVPDAARSTNEQMALRQVLVDIPRTLPEVPLFKNQRIKDMMARVLYLYALKNPSTGYVQGFNELICPFMLVYFGGYFDGKEVRACECEGSVEECDEKSLCIEHISDEIFSEVEADTYHSLTILLSNIQTHYTEDQPGLQRNIVKLSKVVKRVDLPLHNHLMDQGMMYQQLCFRWFHNFLLRETSIKNIIRIWDTYLSCSGFGSFHVYVCAAILVQDSEKIRGMPLEEIFQYIQQMHYDDDINILLSQAYVLSTLFDGNEAHLG